jgi:Arc/MetJ family transcription regulator
MCMNTAKYTQHKIVRTNIVIDEQLMNDALKATGLKTKKEAVELGLKTLIRLNQQEQIKLLKGKLKWDGDLDTMRNNLLCWLILVFGLTTLMAKIIPKQIS